MDSYVAQGHKDSRLLAAQRTLQKIGAADEKQAIVAAVKTATESGAVIPSCSPVTKGAFMN